MSEHIKALINQLLSSAKQRGFTQAQLATQAGITAVGLSQIKKRGDLRTSTLEDLGDQLDLELIFMPKKSRDQAIERIKAGRFFNTSADTTETSEK
ncbi:MAG: hypothetical protein ABW168_14655 [Sedimenticola sp.]